MLETKRGLMKDNTSLNGVDPTAEVSQTLGKPGANTVGSGQGTGSGDVIGGENDGESRDKFIRTQLEYFLHENVIGVFIMNSISFISIVTSIMFIVLTYIDHSQSDPCCISFYELKDASRQITLAGEG